MGWCKLRVSKNGRCGRKFKGTRCAAVGTYCSRWGWCGRSSLHKRTSTKKYNGRRCGRVVKRSVKRRKAVKRVMKRISFRFKKGKKFVARWALLSMRLMKKSRAAWRARRSAWRDYLKNRRNKAKRVVMYKRFKIYRLRHIRAARALRLHKLRVRRRYRAMRLRMRKIRVSWRVARRVAKKSKYAKRLRRRSIRRIRILAAKRRVFRRLIVKVRRVTRRGARWVRRNMNIRRRRYF